MILHGTIQQTPAPGATIDAYTPLDELTAEADDYDTAYTRLKQQLPDSWRLITFRQP